MSVYGKKIEDEILCSPMPILIEFFCGLVWPLQSDEADNTGAQKTIAQQSKIYQYQH